MEYFTPPRHPTTRSRMSVRRLEKIVEQPEKMSASARLLYQEEDVLGKGIGCIAIKHIKKGTLVIREVLQLLL